MSQDNTATQGTNATQVDVTKQDTSTKQKEIESSRAFKKVEAKTFSIAPAGIFNAVVIEVAFIGTYTRTFTKGEETTSRDYEFVGFAFKFVDLNTGVENIIYSEVALSYVDGSRLRGYIDALALGCRTETF
jgi:DNA polymerase sigma